jgi:multicomponent Na+:H+ antiporter subunit D
MNTILLIVIPLLAAFIALVAKKGAPYLLLGAGLFNIVLLFFLDTGFTFIGGFDQAMTSDLLGIALYLDTYAKIALWLVNTLIVVIALLNFKAYKQYGSVLLLSMAGLNGLLLTNDLFNFFVFLEIASIAAYLITVSNRKFTDTFHYIVMGILGGSLFLFGVTILYAMTGSLNMIVIASELETNGQYQDVILPFIFIFIGLGVEVKLLPFNSWVKGVLASSNTFSGPMIASVYAAAMSFAMGRLLTNLLVFEGALLTVVMTLLIIGVVAGDLMAFSTSKTREILLFSSIAQASLIALLFVQGIVIWAVYLIIVNALSKLVMFLVINKATHAIGSDEIKRMKGLFVNNKFVGLMFTLATLSIMGLPLFAGFVIKLNFLTSLASLGQTMVLIIILGASLVESIYFVRLLVRLWYPGEETLDMKYSNPFKFVFAAVALILLVLGTYTTPLYELDDNIDQVSEEVIHG